MAHQQVRGDPALLEPGLDWQRELTGLPVAFRGLRCAHLLLRGVDRATFRGLGWAGKLGGGKQESGESPERSRHCDRGAIADTPLRRKVREGRLEQRSGSQETGLPPLASTGDDGSPKEAA